MKVVAFGNSGWCLYNYRRNLLVDLTRKGATVITLSPEDSYCEKLREIGIEHRVIDLKPKRLNPFQELSTIWSLFQILRDIDPDYVLSFTIKCNIYAGLCRFLLPFGQIANVSGLGEVFERGGLLNRMVSTLYKVALSKAQQVFFQNDDDRRYCISSGLVPDTTSTLIPGSGVDLSRFAPSYPPVTRGQRVFLMFGRLLPKKGYDEFLTAAEQLKPMMGDEISFWILGIEDKNRPESAALLNRIQAAEARGIVRYIPPKYDVRPIIQQADVVVLPSAYNEGVPRSLLEALACGKPIITTDWKGCRETIAAHNINGKLVPIENPTALADAIKDIAILSDERLRLMGEASRKLAEDRFDERLVIDAYLKELGYRESPASLHKAA